MYQLGTALVSESHLVTDCTKCSFAELLNSEEVMDLTLTENAKQTLPELEDILSFETATEDGTAYSSYFGTIKIA
ncbi:MAG: hypothetical protein GY861_11505 [bacterium]|nr:hypothetical protein [bacterium]